MTRYPNIKLPEFKASYFFGQRDAKIIEARKLEIEDFILSLLTNMDFQKTVD